MNAEILTELKSPETISYGGVKFPKFLISRQIFEEKMAKIRGIILQSKTRLAEGASNVDAGDTHGQYHNELAWYREQEISTANKRAADLGEGLDKAYTVEDYNDVRQRVKSALNISEISIATLGARIKVAYGEDPDDVEEIILVAPLDGGAKPGWVSIDAPLARAIEGKKVGERCPMGKGKIQTVLRILAIG